MPGERGAEGSSRVGAERLAAARWRACGASVQGSSHRRASEDCQDVHDWVPLSGGGLAAAVADGAGSASHGGLGAALAAGAALETIAAATNGEGRQMDSVLWVALMRQALADARGALEAEAAHSGLMARDLATTLILAVASDEQVAVAQVGDGAAVAAGAEGELVSLTRPQHGEYVNQTTFLSASRALETAQIQVQRDRFRHLALFTDGLERLALELPGADPFAPFFEPLFTFAAKQSDPDEGGRKLADFLRSPRVARRAHDDLTLLLVTRIRDGEDANGTAQVDQADADTSADPGRGH